MRVFCADATAACACACSPTPYCFPPLSPCCPQVNYDAKVDLPVILEMGEALGRPAHTVVGIQSLALDGARVEIEATAVVPAAKLADLRRCQD